MESISFSIAGCEIRLLMPFRPEVTRGFQPFLCAPGEAPLTVSLLPVQALPEVRGRELLRNYAFAVFRTEDGFFRVFHDRREGDRPYAVGHLEPDGRETIEYLEADRGFFSETANCFSHIALEALLLQRDAMILHASFVSTRYGGLLFSGVSGIGKSTQADLWQRYEGAELLNGDRTVLRRMDGVWTAFGSPYAGSSNCFVNESRRISRPVCGNDRQPMGRPLCRAGLRPAGGAGRPRLRPDLYARPRRGRLPESGVGT